MPDDEAPFFDYYELLHRAGFALPDRASAGMAATKTRPLAEKLEAVLQVLEGSLRCSMNARTKQHALTLMQRSVSLVCVRNPDRAVLRGRTMARGE